MKKRAVQLELHMPTHGGARDGAGRKREGPRDCVPHVPREEFRAGSVHHVTLRLHEGIPSLRQQSVWSVVVGVLLAVRGRAGFRIVQVSVQTNHLHLLVEAEDAAALEHGMRSLGTRLAKRINRCFDRSGELFADRYHARAIATPREARAALAYVLLNARKHAAELGRTLARHWIDPYSSAATFDGWATQPRIEGRASDCGTSPPTTWLLAEGWRRHGLVAVDEVPGGRRPPRGNAEVEARATTPAVELEPSVARRREDEPRDRAPHARWPVIADAWGVDRARDAA